MKAVRRLWLPMAATMVLGAIQFGVMALPASAQGAGPYPPPAGAPADPFGAEVVLTEKTIVYLAGSGLWDSAFETITGALKSVSAELDKQGVKPNGPPMIIYTATDDTGFQFQAAAPVARATSRLANRQPAKRSNSSIAAPMTPWIRPTKRSPIISTTSGSKPAIFSSSNI
jgi:hypothetical protein